MYATYRRRQTEAQYNMACALTVYSDHWVRLGEILQSVHWMALCLSATFSTAFFSRHGDCVKFVFSKLWVTESSVPEMPAFCVCVCLSWSV